jgi:hypothetical protein
MLPAETCAESWCATAPATPADVRGSGPSGRTASGPGVEGGNNPCCAQPCCDQAVRERTSVQPPKSARKIKHLPSFRPRRSELLRLHSKFGLFPIGPALTSVAGKYSDLISYAGIEPRYSVRTHPPAWMPGCYAVQKVPALAALSIVRRPSGQKDRQAPSRTAAS